MAEGETPCTALSEPKLLCYVGFEAKGTMRIGEYKQFVPVPPLSFKSASTLEALILEFQG